MSEAVSVFVCTGCDIGAALDTDALGEVASEDFSIGEIHTHPALCNDEGVAQVRATLGEDGKAVLCACSPREKCEAFRFGDHVVTRANFREGVVWSHPTGDEDTQMLAEDYLRMAVTQAEKTTTPKPFDEEITKSLLVVGGGIAGLKAALSWNAGRFSEEDAWFKGARKRD